MSAINTQVGGDHYKNRDIQPFHFSGYNQIDPFCHTILKYLTRWRDKGGLQDLYKARHVAELRIEFDCEFMYPPQGFVHPRIPMGDYVAANHIPPGEDVVFYALEGWYMAGRRPLPARIRFMDALDRYITFAEAEVAGQPLQMA